MLVGSVYCDSMCFLLVSQNGKLDVILLRKVASIVEEGCIKWCASLYDMIMVEI